QARPAQLSDYHHHRLSGQRDARPNFGERTHHGFEKAAQSRAIERNRSYSRPQRSGQARRVRATRSSKMGHLALDWSLVTDHLSLRLKCAVSSVVEHYLDTVGVRGSKPLPRTSFSRLMISNSVFSIAISALSFALITPESFAQNSAANVVKKRLAIYAPRPHYERDWPE